jgi:hypothetical protein
VKFHLFGLGALISFPIKISLLLHYHEIKFELHGRKFYNDYVHNVWPMANFLYEYPRLALRTQRRDIRPPLQDIFNPSCVTFSIQEYWHLIPSAMTAGFLKDRSESAGTPVGESRRLSLSERRFEQLTHLEKEMILAIPRVGALQTTVMLVGVREQPS